MSKRFRKDTAVSGKIRDAARYISEDLIKHGCLVHRYDAVKTNSVYLKVDAGVACSIRLSDHQGYDYLKYRYNYMAQVPGAEVWQVTDGHERFYYQSGAIDRLIEDVLALREQRMEIYQDYKGLIERSLRESKTQAGFWQGAYCVNNKMKKGDAA